MKATWFVATGLALAVAGGAAAKQQTDYLNPEEVEKVRDAQEPNQRLRLFLGFAEERLSTFEKALAPTPDQELTHPDVLQDLLNDFINAVDDAATTLDWAMERGGVDLRKSRDPLANQGQGFIARLQHIQKTNEVVRREFSYDLEDALLATQDLMELGKKIPDKPIPPKLPGVVAGAASEEKPVPTGRPTLKRRKEKEKKEKEEKEEKEEDPP